VPVSDYFTDDLPEIIDGYEKREEQLEMAEAVSGALDNSECLIIEAGTGVGKTLAYLIPMAEYALENKKRVIISTYSKALQGQIFKKDLPVVHTIFPDLKYEIIYGAGNYACIRRFKEFSSKGSLFSGAASTDEILEFIREAGGLRENTKFNIPDDVWKNINREKHMCQEEACRHFRKCHYWTMRHRLRKAHIIIVNHHLFFSDLIVNKKLLPEASAVVFDEAHRLEETMRGMFSLKFSVKEYFRLLKELEDFIKLRKKQGVKNTAHLKNSVKKAKNDFEGFLASAQAETGILSSQTALFTKDSVPFEAYINVTDSLRDTIFDLKEAQTGADNSLKKLSEYLLETVSSHAETLERWLLRKDGSYFYWAELGRDRDTAFYVTPYDLKKDFEEHVRFNYECVVFTSATLSAGDNFNYVVKRFGLEDAVTGLLKSPFDYKNNSLLYLDRGLPTPQEPEYKNEVIKKIETIIREVGGGVLVLFTSNDLMRAAKSAMEGRFPGMPMLIQGEAGAMELIEMFRKKPAVLFATSSFWQGIDIKGDALKCVIITRLPFEVPDHPMQKAIYSHAREEGGDDFSGIALPRAIFMLKQGFGRLIRSKDDYGVVAILDSRITKKGYGKKFVQALPEARVTYEAGDIGKFFREKTGAKKD
jgi:ATP-dependent DNA helicase DinG